MKYIIYILLLVFMDVGAQRLSNPAWYERAGGVSWGANILSNGDFSSGDTDWEIFSWYGETFGYEITSGRLVIDKSGYYVYDNNGYCAQDGLTIEPNTDYRLTYDLTFDTYTEGNVRIVVANSANGASDAYIIMGADTSDVGSGVGVEFTTPNDATTRTYFTILPVGGHPEYKANIDNLILQKKQ